MSGLLWGTLEVTTAFVIACMPSTRLFIQHFFPVLATKFTTAVSSKRITGSVGTILEVQNAARFGAGGDRRSKMTGPTTSALNATELDEIPLRTADNEEARVGDSV